MSIVHASAHSVRHALARALATHNKRPAEATFRLVGARVSTDSEGRVVRAEVSVGVEAPVESSSDPRAQGLVNPLGHSPLMALIPGTRTLLDIFFVTWERWVRLQGGPVAPNVDPWTVRAGLSAVEAAQAARAAGKRLPSEDELRAAWGPHRFPWGNAPDPNRGLAEPLKYEELFEVGLWPPNPHGFFDLGAGSWTFLATGGVFGGAPGPMVSEALRTPCGLRFAQTL